MAKAKGIRVNQLAKELGIPSKAILDRCKAEGLGEKVPNHMSLMSLGLAETVREWFPQGGGGVATAVETATEAAVDTAKPKTTRRKKKGEEGEHEVEQHDEHPGDEAEAAGADETAEAGHEPSEPAEEQPAAEMPEPVTPQPVAKAEEPAPAAPVAEAPTAPAPVAEAPAPAAPAPVAPAVEAAPAPAPTPTQPVAPVVQAPAAPTPPAPTPAAAPTPTAPTPAAAPMPVVQQPPAVMTPAAAAAPAPVQAKSAAPAPVQAKPAVPAPAAPPTIRPRVGGKPGSAPTVRLESGKPGTPPAPPRKPVVVAPKLLVPAPAKIQGPRIVREEQPDVVPTPRPRRGPMESSQPSFVQARPQGGRGVRVSGDEDEETAEAKKKAAGKGSGRTLSARRRGPDGRRGEAMEKLKEYTEADLIERRDRLAAASSYRAGFDSELKKRAERGQHGPAKSIIQRGEPVVIEEPISIKALSAALGIKANDILVKLMRQGIMANVNRALDADTAIALALDYGVELQIEQEASLEEQLEKELAERQPEPENLAPRPPVVTILGHVDHGKTSLLDKIRKANVAAGEAGGITQHTAAWMVQLGEKRVTFIDTPGHQAFTSMRARGAAVTDVVVLVVSAAEGVQPQTIESINHARAAGVPIVVAMNKIDRPDANPDMILGQLAKEGLNPVEWGGDTEVIRTSATTGQGIPELIEILDYQAELLDLKTDPTAPARGTVVESRVDEGLGAVATVLVQDGTLRVGDTVLAGNAYGRIRSLVNDRGEMIQEAGASTPVIVSGLNAMPNAGDKFYGVEDVDRARAIAEERQNQARQKVLSSQNKVTLSNLFDNIEKGQTKTINLIIKADVQGSIETLAKTVTDQNTEEVRVKVIHAAVGGITESDVDLAAATRDENSNTVIIGFHVVPDEPARHLAEQRHVEIRLYRVIYEIFDDLKKALSGMLEPEVREKLHGHAEIRQVFKVSRLGNIAGCMVTDGHIQRGSKIRLIRDGAVVTEDLTLESLKRLKDDVREVKAGFECGLKIAGYDDIKVGDRLEAYSRELIHRTL